MKKFTVEKAIVIDGKAFQTTEQVAKFVKKHGEKNICPSQPHLKCIHLNTAYCPLEASTGIMEWITEDGEFVSEDGYLHDISSFI
jgi:hypothetical protein